MKTTSSSFSITHWYQPIFCMKSDRIFGYEALMRSTLSADISPLQIIEDAKSGGQYTDLDFHSIYSARRSFKERSTPLFINIFPSTLLEKKFLTWWDQHIPYDMPVVLELLENESIVDWSVLRDIIKELKIRGVKIAIDDMGSGYSFFQQWVELSPDFIKLDRYFAANLSRNLLKQKVIANLIKLFEDTTELIIEGIEKQEDLEIICELGIHYAQGYLLGKPAPLDFCILEYK